MRGFVYFARAGAGPIKIGFAQDAPARIAALQTANAERLTLLGQVPAGSSFEKALQRRFEADRIRGEWWFRPSADLCRLIEDLTLEGLPGWWKFAIELIEGPDRRPWWVAA